MFLPVIILIGLQLTKL